MELQGLVISLWLIAIGSPFNHQQAVKSDEPIHL
jgi:hypothetical protein